MVLILKIVIEIGLGDICVIEIGLGDICDICDICGIEIGDLYGIYGVEIEDCCWISNNTFIQPSKISSLLEFKILEFAQNGLLNSFNIHLLLK